jgi:hypothetical protein
LSGLIGEGQKGALYRELEEEEMPLSIAGGRLRNLGIQPVEVTKMVNMSVEVRDGANHFNVSVTAQSIKRAVNVVRGSYPGRTVRAKFPIDPEGFFVKEPTPRAEIVRIDQPDSIAA